ncbi:hypothetical protein K0651_03900 [Ornithinimicrobium sp. Arc0846-15]|nr:hypothetical protein [Ornithinimicrobium laminariae]
MNDQQRLAELPDEALAFLRHVLRSESRSATGHAKTIGWSQQRAEAVTAALESRGLVRVGADQVVRALDPRVSIGRLLDRAEFDIESQRARIADLRESIDSLERDFRQGQQDAGPTLPLFEEVTAAHAPEVIEGLDRLTTGPVLQVTAQIEVGPGHDPGVSRLRRDSLMQGREVKSIFSIEVLQHSTARAIAEERASAGERQRFLDAVPVQFAVFGDAGVLMSAGDDSAAEFLLVRSAALVQAFKELFQEMWRRAEPLDEFAPAQQSTRIMELMALGFKDEAIARHLGVGLRTVRRRISDEMSNRGVDTRFQLGLAAGRSGVIDQRKG